MRIHPTDPRLYLVEPSDLRKDPLPPDVQENLAPLSTVVAWAGDYLCRPHAELGRSGAICPFVQPSIRRDLFFLTAVRGADLSADQVEEIVRAYRDWFVELEPTDPRLAQYKTINVLFPDLQPEAWKSVLEALQERLKPEYASDGVMIGEFHPGPPDRAGLWNPEFRPNKSPVPLLSIRHMVPSDFVFLRGRRDWMESYLRLHGDRIPEPMVDEARRVAGAFGLALPEGYAEPEPVTVPPIVEPEGGEPESIPIIADLDAVPADLVTRLMGDLDAYHRALGGAGLEIRTVKTGSEAIEGALV